MKRHAWWPLGVGAAALAIAAGTTGAEAESPAALVSAQQLRAEELANNSNAVNYGSGLTESVNTRTGELTLGYPNVSLPGIVPDMGVDLAITFTRVLDLEHPQQLLGLAYGWSFNIPYVGVEKGVRTLYLGGEGSYALDSAWKSVGVDGDYFPGLRYYNLRDRKMTVLEEFAKVPCKNDASYEYVYLHSQMTGTNQYFDRSGLLLCIEDRFDNEVVFYYDRPFQPVTPQNAKLSRIVDTYGQEIIFDYEDEEGEKTAFIQRIVMPDEREINYTMTENYITGITNPIGETTTIQLDNQKRPDKIFYPTGLVTVITYNESAIKYALD